MTPFFLRVLKDLRAVLMIPMSLGAALLCRMALRCHIIDFKGLNSCGPSRLALTCKCHIAPKQKSGREKEQTNRVQERFGNERVRGPILASTMNYRCLQLRERTLPGLPCIAVHSCPCALVGNMEQGWTGPSRIGSQPPLQGPEAEGGCPCYLAMYYLMYCRHHERGQPPTHYLATGVEYSAPGGFEGGC